ncbi:hypothetical protein BCR37DRAFT_395937 [Protomyces lactucae-debilis]|uniref:Uncharacterized protein n=1 Tax=Protomyces lactucae-debilis TaxID=2754530 RepID=A0A1Y2EQ61_PROLT|nr:uncharacterized protein BCR37DRAFT_395937 [Protomyces lactucae-debilis]ORY73677.1 hypothetical protein BCR37DRAFT_395937 [Protomyces lactucae-debilis]
MVASSTANSELQRIWRLVQELSAQLKENQLETEHLRRQAQYLQLPEGDGDEDDLPEYATKGNAGVNGHAQQPGHERTQSRMTDTLMQQHEQLIEENRKLKQDTEDMSFLLAEYELGLSTAMDKIRVHEHDLTLSVVHLKRRHQEELDAERERTRGAQQQYAQLQQEVQRIQGLVRQAYEAQTGADADVLIERLQVENAALQAENAGYQAAVGVEALEQGNIKDIAPGLSEITSKPDTIEVVPVFVANELSLCCFGVLFMKQGIEPALPHDGYFFTDPEMEVELCGQV